MVLIEPAQVVGLIASIMMIIAIQIKDKKDLFLIFNILVKILYAINFALLNEFAGATTQIIGLVITVIAYVYAKKKISIPKWLTCLFVAITIINGFFTCKRLVGIMAIVCGITYALIVSSKDMKKIRVLNFIQSLLWTIYDFVIGAYTASFSSAFVFISTIIAIYRYDFKKNNCKIKEQKED